MSAKIIGWVWDANITDKTEKYVLSAYADHADENGGSIYPSVSLIAWKTGHSERYVRTIKARLISKGYMVQYDTSEFLTPVYRIVKEALPAREKWQPVKQGRPLKTPDLDDRGYSTDDVKNP